MFLLHGSSPHAGRFTMILPLTHRPKKALVTACARRSPRRGSEVRRVATTSTARRYFVLHGEGQGTMRDDYRHRHHAWRLQRDSKLQSKAILHTSLVCVGFPSTEFGRGASNSKHTTHLSIVCCTQGALRNRVNCGRGIFFI